jgi:23S rRNA A1618 N6-methylase RlmF
MYILNKSSTATAKATLNKNAVFKRKLELNLRKKQDRD